MSDFTTSYHADDRARKRYKKSDVSGLFKEALEHGQPINSFKGTFGRYLAKQSITHRSNGVVYRNTIFWFGKDKVLRTTYQLHPKWHKYTDKQKKTP